MDNLVRREIIADARTLVIKIGTNVLSRDDDTLDVDRIAQIAEQIHRVRQTGRQVVVVSSGAIGAGIGLLGLKQRPTDLPHLQAAAATGQAYLIRLYDDCLRKHGYHAAQLLLTANDFKSRTRYLNVRNTLHTLFEYKAMPIVNENDTVSVAEIKFGDNDQLAAMVTGPVARTAARYSLRRRRTLQRRSQIARQQGDSARRRMERFASGTRQPRPQPAWHRRDAVEARGRPHGHQRRRKRDHRQRHPARTSSTKSWPARKSARFFWPRARICPAWKRWIGFTVRPKGRFVLDDGARQAIEKQGKSLLAIGITAVEGDFAKGEVVSLVDRGGDEFARGLSNYNANDARSIAGKRSEEIIQALGSLPYAEVINRDNLVVTT